MTKQRLFIFSYKSFQLDHYKIVPAHTVVLHVYEQFEIDYMKNKTFLSFIQTNAETTTSAFVKNTTLQASIFYPTKFVGICALPAEASSEPIHSP